MKVRDRRAVPEVTRVPGRLSFKTAASETGQVLALDEAEGIVTAIVSVTGTVDEVNDIIVPGAYRETLTKRNPKVCWAHSWERPIGRTLHIEELLPGDERLPTETKDGSPWPEEAGALVATMQFNMRTDEGKNAFEVVRFYSESGECEYSIGYQVPAGKSNRTNAGVRNIKALDLYEVSVVLFGAHTMTGTLSLKDLARDAIEAQRLTPEEQAVVRMSAKATLAAVRENKAPPPAPPFTKKPKDDEPEQAAPEKPDEPEKAKPEDEKESSLPDWSDGIMVALYPDPAAADALAKAIAGPDETVAREDLHVTLAYLGRVGESGLNSDDIVSKLTTALEGEDGLRGTIGGVGTFPADDDNGVPTWVPVDVPGLTMLRETVADALGDDVDDEHGFTPHITIGWDLGLPDPIESIPVTFRSVCLVYGDQKREVGLGNVPAGDDAGEDDVPPWQKKAGVDYGDPWYERLAEPETKRKLTAEQRRKKPTLPGSDTAWPIGDKTDLEAAINSIGRAKESERGKVKRWIIRRARSLGLVNLIPEGWSNSKALDTDLLPEREIASLTAAFDAADRFGMLDSKAGGADRNRGNAEKLRRYWTVGEGGAKIAWNTPGDFTRCVALLDEHMPGRAEGYCANRHKEMTGMWPGDRGNKADAYDPALEEVSVETKYMTTPEPGKGYPRLSGSYEERQDALQQAVTEALRGDQVDDDRYEWPGVCIDATFDDRVIATRMKYDGTDERETFEMDYRHTPTGVELGTPERRELEVVAVGVNGEEADVDTMPLGDLMPFALDLDMLTHRMKVAHLASAETKAGRVLSGANERRLREAMENLVNVLAAAGVKITVDESAQEDEDENPQTSKRSDERKLPDPSVDMTTTSPSASVKSIERPDGTFVLTKDGSGRIPGFPDDDVVMVDLAADLARVTEE